MAPLRWWGSESVISCHASSRPARQRRVVLTEPGLSIQRCDPASQPARVLSGALWEEIQRRYGFEAPNPFDPAAFVEPVGAIWVAEVEDRPVGSVGLAALSEFAAELDVMYVAPTHRRSGVAQALLAALEDHARAVGVSVIRLRAGEPQPEAVRFYRAAGFAPIAPFGKWVDDDTARCFEKALRSPAADRRR